MSIKNKKILITGGCGYVGTLLTEMLLKQNYKITVVDINWFGNVLQKNKNLRIIKMNVCNIDKINLRNFDTIIHLANIVNDPAAELDSKLTWEVNVLFTNKLVNHAIKFGVKKFIYASSGSVYGVKKEQKVTENLSLVPISDYNKTKMIAERILINYKKKIKIYCIRPATVCGYSRNMRLDVSVNMFVYQAISKRIIKIFGGKQIRPNIHIIDLCRIFSLFLKKNLKPGFYNAGFENLKIIEIAKKIKNFTHCKIKVIKQTNDPRSYKQDSTKLLRTGFKPKFNVNYAIQELVNNFKEKKIKVSENFFRVKFIKKKLFKKK